MFSMVGTYQPDKTITKNKFFLTLSVDYYSATLWYSPYNDYQQFLFDTISKMHDEGNSFIKIAKWLNQNHYLTPRGSDFKPNHAWSIYTKKNRSIQRFSRVYEPNISDLSIDVVDYMPMLG